MSLLLPLLAHLILVASLWPWTALYDRRPTLRLLTCLVTTSVIIVSLQVALGHGHLAQRPLLLATTIVVFCLWAGWLLRRLIMGTPPASPGVDASLLGRLGLEPPSKVGLILGSLTAIAYTVLLGVAVLVPPYAWDTLVYHLTDVFYAAQTRSLALFPFPARHYFFPQVGELHSLWYYLLAGAGGEAWRVTGVALLPFGLIAAVAARAAIEGLGLRTARPWIIPAMLLAPVIMIQPLSGYIDVGAAAFVLAGFAYAICAATEGRFSHIGFCALASGLAMGVKISFVYFGLPILAVLMSQQVWQAITRGGSSRAAGRLLLCAALFSVGCGYWIGRNLLLTGNPLYPNRVAIGRVTVFEGPREITPSKRQQSWFVPSTVSWARYPFLETFGGKPAYSIENGFGPVFAAGIFGTLIALPFAFFRRRWILFRALLAMPLTIIGWLWLSPYQEPRYIIACCGFALIGLASVAGMVHRRSAPAEAKAGIWSRAPMIVLHACVATGIVASALGAIGSLAPDLPQVIARWKAGTWEPEVYYRLQYGAVGDAFNWLSTSTPGGGVTLTNNNFVAPIYGWHGSNRVFYQSIAGDEPFGLDPRVATYRAWRRLLYRHGVTWVVEWVPWWGEEPSKKSEAWIANHPDDFELLKDFAGRAKIFRPVFGAAEVAAFDALGEGPDLGTLSSPDAWTLEYREDTAAQLTAVRPPQAGEQTSIDLTAGPDPFAPATPAPQIQGVEITYQFQTAHNSYCDFRADLDEGDWSRFAALSFDVESETRTPTLLFVYLKDRDPRRACRFRIDLYKLGPGRHRVDLDLTSPSWSTPKFVLSRMAELHLVVDDDDDALTGTGTLRIGDFRLD